MNDIAATYIAPTVTVFTRHSPKCPKKANRLYRACKCRKAVYVYADGHDEVISAKTRSWAEAEKFAQQERDRRDPVKIRLREIEEENARKEREQESLETPIAVAAERWKASQKYATPKTAEIYARAAWRICTWAGDTGLVNVRDITADALDKWRGEWGPTAEKEYSRIGQTSQAQFQGRLKQFCRWCLATGKFDRDPSTLLAPIDISDEKTQPLTEAQFQQLFVAIPIFVQATTGRVQEFAKELKALFLLQRWAGLRILDCLLLPRTGLVCNRLTLVTKKTKALIDGRTMPPCVVEALQDLSPDRPHFRSEYFFWTKGTSAHALSTRWCEIIRRFNAFLSFTDDEGHPMKFHSHQLRDTFAVELLLDGMTLYKVSYLLTHTSIQVTQDHYAPWVRSRKDQLDDEVVEYMRRRGVM